MMPRNLSCSFHCSPKAAAEYCVQRDGRQTLPNRGRLLFPELRKGRIDGLPQGDVFAEVLLTVPNEKNLAHAVHGFDERVLQVDEAYSRWLCHNVNSRIGTVRRPRPYRGRR